MVNIRHGAPVSHQNDGAWDAIYEADAKAALAKVERAARRAEKLLAAVAAGDEGQEAAMVRAVDRAQDLAQGSEIRCHVPTHELAHARTKTLRAAIGSAREAGHVARTTARDAEIARLEGEIHDARNLARETGGFQHELATKGCGFGPRKSA